MICVNRAVGRSIKIIIALLLLFTVVVVCVSPYVDLDPTALRAAQAALALALSIVGNAFLLCCLIRFHAHQLCSFSVSDSSPGSLLDLVCSRLC